MQEDDAFIDMTKKLIGSKNKRIYNHFIEFDIDFTRPLIPATRTARIFKRVFADRSAWFHGEEMGWFEWLMNSNIPMRLLGEIGHDITKIMDHPDAKNIYGRSSTRSYLTMLGRELTYGSHLKYLIERWSQKKFRAYPFFYFDTESCDWIWEELRKNKNQIKSGRASKSCCVNIYFRWDTELDIPIVGIVCKHNQWSHLYQDLYLPHMLGKVILHDYMGIARSGKGSILFVSSTLDDTRRAKQIISKGNFNEQ